MGNNKKVIFVHQGKTGGTTFVDLLKSTYGKEQVYIDIDVQTRRKKSKLAAYLDKSFEDYFTYEDRAEYKVITGHIEPFKYKRAFPKAIFISFFRDPVQKLISVYHFWQRPPFPNKSVMHPVQKKLLEENLSITDFAVLWDRHYPTENIKKFHPKNFNFIGITEKYEESLLLLKKMYLPELTDNPTSNTNLLNTDKALNVNPNKKLNSKYEVENYAFFEKLLAIEIDIYRKAVAKFEQDCKTYGIFV